MHKREIKLENVHEKLAILSIPLKLYLKHGQCKVLLGVARGKKIHDKRQALKDKAMKRDVDVDKARY